MLFRRQAILWLRLCTIQLFINNAQTVVGADMYPVWLDARAALATAGIIKERTTILTWTFLLSVLIDACTWKYTSDMEGVATLRVLCVLFHIDRRTTVALCIIHDRPTAGGRTHGWLPSPA